MCNEPGTLAPGCPCLCIREGGGYPRARGLAAVKSCCPATWSWAGTFVEAGTVSPYGCVLSLDPQRAEWHSHRLAEHRQTSGLWENPVSSCRDALRRRWAGGEPPVRSRCRGGRRPWAPWGPS